MYYNYINFFLIKIVQKNFKVQTNEKVWLDKNNSLDSCPLKIVTLHDHILQKIIWLAIFPIAEIQADKFSFAYRLTKVCANL